MKLRLLFLFISLFSMRLAWADGDAISGVIQYGHKTEGTLLIFVRYFEEDRKNPVAVKMIEGPIFPLNFRITAKDAITPGTPFKGPFIVEAKLFSSKRGWKQSRAFAKGSTRSKKINVNDEDVLITIE